jgi:sulfatase modifying factor 1
MGSEGRFTWESPRHRVFVEAFDIAPTSVTCGEYARFSPDTKVTNPDLPVIGVSWFDAVAYCEWLSKLEGALYRLPTEAEWEKACRGGRSDWEYAWGNEPPESLEYFGGEWKGPRPVGTWRANDFGLFNMGDNVHEWCTDWYGADYYAVSPEENPSGPLTGTRRVSRGGSWRHQIKGSRAAHRSSLPPQFRYADYGFRVVRSLSQREH